MKQVILIHGMPDGIEEYHSGDLPSSQRHWLSWIQKQLSHRDILCQSLQMPKPYEPDYSEYCKVFSQMNISNETILVGHSLGGGFLLRYFSEHPELAPRKIILVAPWIDPDNYLQEKFGKSDFFDFNLDPALTDRTQVVCLSSLDDMDEILKSVQQIREKLPNIIYYEFTDKGHFTESHLGTKEFPELLEIILK
jgi:predicted alpha/beta hydrolase family esterase